MDPSGIRFDVDYYVEGETEIGNIDAKEDNSVIADTYIGNSTTEQNSIIGDLIVNSNEKSTNNADEKGEVTAVTYRMNNEVTSQETRKRNYDEDYPPPTIIFVNNDLNVGTNNNDKANHDNTCCIEKVKTVERQQEVENDDENVNLMMNEMRTSSRYSLLSWCVPIVVGGIYLVVVHTATTTRRRS